MKQHFTLMAAYNRWANARLYTMAAAQPDELLRKPVGVYFKSLLGTLNHLLVADLIWMSRLEGTGHQPTELDAILHDDLAALRRARESEDDRMARFVERCAEADFEKTVEFRTMKGIPMQQPLWEILAHVFNHQTHHRGQAHAALTVLGVSEPESLDLLVMLRERKR